MSDKLQTNNQNNNQNNTRDNNNTTTNANKSLQQQQSTVRLKSASIPNNNSGNTGNIVGTNHALNNNYSDILRLRSHEFYSSLLSFNTQNNNNYAQNNNNQNQRQHSTTPVDRQLVNSQWQFQPVVSANHSAGGQGQGVDINASFGAILRSNSSLSLDQKRIQSANQSPGLQTTANRLQTTSTTADKTQNCFSIASNNNSIDFKDFQELRECRFGSDRTTTASMTSTTATAKMSSKSPTTRVRATTVKSRTMGSIVSAHSLSISNENLSQKMSQNVTKKKTKSLFFKHSKERGTARDLGDGSASGAGRTGMRERNELDLVGEEMERRRRLRQMFIHFDVQSALSLNELFSPPEDRRDVAQADTSSGSGRQQTTGTTVDSGVGSSGVSSKSSSNSCESLLERKSGNEWTERASEEEQSDGRDWEERDVESESENEFNSNSLLAFSQNFRNEIGKELVFCLQLNRENSENDSQLSADEQNNSRRQQTPQSRRPRRQPLHTTALARQLSCLSPFDMSSDAGQSSLLSLTCCPLSCEYNQNILETDFGFSYYRKYFYGFSHQNWFAVCDTGTGTGAQGQGAGGQQQKLAIALSLRKDSKDLKKFRVILRTNSSLKCLKGFLNLNTSSESRVHSVRQNCSVGRAQNVSDMNLKSVFELLLPKHLTQPQNQNILQQNNPQNILQAFRLGVDSKSDELLLKFDELLENHFYKIGILYSRDLQCTEEDFYNNREIVDSDFTQFLQLIGTKVRLKGYKGFRGGLDVSTDTTGLYAYATQHQNNEIIYHVMNELPFSPNNRQQLLRKRHIGNDIVTIVFQSKHFRGRPFSPDAIRSHFQHVFIVVRPHHNGYRVAVCRHRDVPPFGPQLKSFYRKDEFRELLLTKVINAENACHKCAKFKQMALRTRFEYLSDLFQNYSTQHSLHSYSSANNGAAILTSGAGGGQSSGSGSGSSQSSSQTSSAQQLLQFSQQFNKYFSQIFFSSNNSSKSLQKRLQNQNQSQSQSQSQKQSLKTSSDLSLNSTANTSSSDRQQTTTGAQSARHKTTSSETKNIFLENELFFGAKLYESIDDVMADDRRRRLQPKRRLSSTQPSSSSLKSSLMCHSFQQSVDIKRVKMLLNQNFLLVLDKKKVLFALNLEQIIGFYLTTSADKQTVRNQRALGGMGAQHYVKDSTGSGGSVAMTPKAIEIQLKIFFHFGELLLLKEKLEICDDTTPGGGLEDTSSETTKGQFIDCESMDANVENHSILFELKSDLMTKIRDNSTTATDRRRLDDGMQTSGGGQRCSGGENAMRLRQMKEIVLRRNPQSMDSSFGFHVQSKPLNANCAHNVCVFVTEVNEHALRVNELRRGQRLLELCQMALVTLSYDQILDFLKTSQTVSVALVQPLSDGSARANGCLSRTCSPATTQNLNSQQNSAQSTPNGSRSAQKSPKQFAHNNRKDFLQKSLENLSSNQNLNQFQSLYANNNQNLNNNHNNDYENIQTVHTLTGAQNRHALYDTHSAVAHSVAPALYQSTTRQPATTSPSNHLLNSSFGAHYPSQQQSRHMTSACAPAPAQTTTGSIPQPQTTSHSQRPLHVRQQLNSSSALVANHSNYNSSSQTNHSSSQSSTTSSTLQEDLIKLITLNDCDIVDETDLEAEEPNDEPTAQQSSSNLTDSHSSSRYSTATSTPYSSLERRSIDDCQQETTTAAGATTTTGDDCVVTVAKPAFVVNAVNEFGFGRQLIDDNSNVTSGAIASAAALDVLSIEDMDASTTDEDLHEFQWPSLSSAASAPVGHQNHSPAVRLISGSAGAADCEDLELKIQVKELSQEKKRLNETIRQLKEENQRLHFESQTASQQLRKFTEWFFSSNNDNQNE